MINFSNTILGKDLTTLTYQDVVDYFTDEHGESNNVEFKAFSSTYGNFNNNIKGIIRAVCGLLNSEGGIVIWGAPLGVEDQTTREKKFQGALAPVPDYKEKDWVINKISDSISPLPVGINVQVLQNTPTENIYVIEVQPSPYKPHQYENIYLVRLDGQTKPAPHYFVEALFRKISYPNIEGYLKFERAGLIQGPSRYYLDISVLLFNFSRLQNEENIIYRVMVVPGYFSTQTEGTEYLGKEEILHFGTPIRRTVRIIIDPNELSQNNNRVHLILTIGGKKSPVKASDYTLDFGNVNLSRPMDTTAMIVSQKENQLLYEMQDQLGTTRESTLLSALGRNPN